MVGRPPKSIGTAGSISIQRYGDGYRARTRFRDFDGMSRLIERHGRSKAAAERKLKEALRDRLHLNGAGDFTPETRFAEIAEAWYREAVDAERSPTTLEAYRGCLDRHVLPALGAFRIREVTTGTVDRFRRSLVGQSGPGSAKMARSIVSGVCGLACRRDVLAHNPVRDVSSVRQPQSPRDALSLEAARQFLALATYHDKSIRRDLLPLAMAMIGTGARVGEMCALTWDALKLDKQLLEVRGTTVRLKGQGTLVKPSPKTEAGFRTLRLPSWLVELLQMRSEHPREAITDIPLTTGGVWHDSPVFPSEHGFLRDRRNTAADLKELFEFCGLEAASSHLLRRTVATLMDEAGLSPRAGADQLGHAQASMTMNRYWGRGVADSGAARVLETLGF